MFQFDDVIYRNIGIYRNIQAFGKGQVKDMLFCKRNYYLKLISFTKIMKFCSGILHIYIYLQESINISGEEARSDNHYKSTDNINDIN